MKIVVQRVDKAEVEINNSEIRQINAGLVLLVGFAKGDGGRLNLELKKVIDKIINLRIFTDEQGKLNKSIIDIKGQILIISNFTLLANCQKGHRPSFKLAEDYNLALELYNNFVFEFEQRFKNVFSGEFGADMKINLINNGPVTLILDF